MRIVSLTLSLAMLAGCLHDEPASMAAVDLTDARSHVRENFTLVSSTRIVNARLPDALLEQTGNCYGFPCEEAPADAVWTAEQDEQALQLALVAAAFVEVQSHPPEPVAFDADAVQADAERIEATGALADVTYIEAATNCYVCNDSDNAEDDALRAAILAAVADRLE